MELRALDAYQLRCLEQPFAPRDLAAHRALADTMSTPIGLDESLSSPAKIDEALAAGACRVACIKPGRLGGVFAALSAARPARRLGWTASWAGSSSRASAVRSMRPWRAGPNFGLPGDVADPDRATSRTSPFTFLLTDLGEVRLSNVPGLGVEPRAEILQLPGLSDAAGCRTGHEPGPVAGSNPGARAYNRAPMQRFFVERRIRRRPRTARSGARRGARGLRRAVRGGLDAAEDARLRSLVSETPLATHEYGEVRRHADAMARARDALIATVTELEQRRDELLQYVGAKRR